MPVRVLVAGGGVAALETVVGLHQLAPGRVETLLLAPDRDFVYRPLATGDPFALGPPRRYPLDDLLGRVDAGHFEDTLAWVDSRRSTVHTGGGRTLAYDALVVTLGAVQVPVFDHALTFTGPDSTEAMHGVVQDLEAGYVRRLAFVVPEGITWPLPAYELALQSAERAFEGAVHVEITVVTPERAPLEVFGPEGSAAVTGLLEQAGVRVLTGSHVQVPARGRIEIDGGRAWVEADRVIAVPRLEGPRVRGLPTDRDGFIPTDEHGRVIGTPGVFAAGDVTAFPVKQGGVATQQADAALEVIAAEAGADVTPAPFRPVLRGMLLTGAIPQVLRYDRAEGTGTVTAGRTLWWPPGKIAGKFLASFLGEQDGEAPPEGVPLEVAYEVDAHEERRRAAITPRPAGG